MTNAILLITPCESLLVQYRVIGKSAPGNEIAFDNTNQPLNATLLM